MTTLLKQTEAAPASWPSTDYDDLGDIAWQRIETFIVHRFTPRAVVWIVEGPGEWFPPLSPATVATVEIWGDGAWSDVTPDASPLGGYWLTGCGPYRFTGTAGGGDVPPIVAAAVDRLAAYLGADPGRAGVRSESLTIEEISRSMTRSAAFMAQAMQNSGAADLLRSYRRV